MAPDNIKQIEEEVEKLFRNAEKMLTLTRNKMNETSENKESSTWRDLQNIRKTFRDELEKLKEAAGKAKVEIASCLKVNESRLMGLANEITEEVAQYISSRMSEAISAEQKSLEKIRAIVAEVENNIAEAKLGKSKQTKAIDDAKALLKDMPAKLEVAVQSAIFVMGEIETEIAEYASMKTRQYQTDGSQILAVISKCIADHLDPDVKRDAKSDLKKKEAKTEDDKRDSLTK